MTDFTQDELRAALSYDYETGVFVWIKTYRNHNLGRVAGCLDKDGYVQIKFKKRLWRAHRLAWFYVYGVWPKMQIDHENGNRSDNSIKNLRDVNCAGNSQNRRTADKDSSTGLLGIDYQTRWKKYRARIMINGQRMTLGGFKTKEDAHQAYLLAKRTFHNTCTI
jgi:HNH endonuclease